MDQHTGKLILGFHHLPHGGEGIGGMRGPQGTKGQAQRLKRAGGHAGKPTGGLALRPSGQAEHDVPGGAALAVAGGGLGNVDALKGTEGGAFPGGSGEL